MPTLRPIGNRVDGLANFEVLDPQVHQRGLKAVIGAADLDACSGQVNIAQEVGKLNARQAEFDTLFKANVCVDSAITFSNGQTWHVPGGSKPSSRSYTRTKDAPMLDPASM